jgi:hypothetical protein
MTLMAGRQKLGKGDLRHRFSERLDAIHGPHDFRSAFVCFRNDPRDRMTVPRDHHGLAALNVVEYLGQASLRIGGFHSAHGAANRSI